MELSLELCVNLVDDKFEKFENKWVCIDRYMKEAFTSSDS